ncbi:MAG: hypothetical protein Q9169_006509 [Polycauliona sp. 2 TL-2023]
MLSVSTFIVLFAVTLRACDDCYGPSDEAAHLRRVRRAQPDAQQATVAPRAPLEWGQLNFLHTTDTHGWLEGEIAYETFNQFSKVYGDRYITSNIQITNPATGQFEYIGSKYRYFTTDHGLRIMAFGVLFDFTGNSNVSRVIKTEDLVKESWFLGAVQYPQPIDLFIVIGHNPIRPSVSSSTFGTLYNISRRYCETLGWASMSGINSSTFRGNKNPRGVPNPSQKAIKVSNTTSSGINANSTSGTSGTSSLVYSRRYLDWNRLTFSYHAIGSQDHTFDYHSGQRVTDEITEARKQLNLTALYGCAPETTDGEEPNLDFQDFDFNTPLIATDACTAHDERTNKASSPRLDRRIDHLTRNPRHRRAPAISPGYVTTDDFGTDGDDTPHSSIPFFSQPNDVQANASFPASGLPETVDLVFLDFIGTNYVIPALTKAGGKYTKEDISYYVDKEFTTNSYLPAYAQKYWQANVPSCPVGQGVGNSD